jgi:hypothetical protein
LNGSEVPLSITQDADLSHYIIGPWVVTEIVVVCCRYWRTIIALRGNHSSDARCVVLKVTNGGREMKCLTCCAEACPL